MKNREYAFKYKNYQFNYFKLLYHSFMIIFFLKAMHKMHDINA